MRFLILFVIIILYIVAQRLHINFTSESKTTSVFKCTCNITEDGTLEVLQLKQYFAMNSEKFFEKFNTPTSPNAKSFHVHNVTVTDCCVSFMISEYSVQASEIPSVGGSSFLIVITSEHHLATCSITDHFNGQYIVNCPLFDFCVDITAEASYINFGAFYEQKYTASLVFWTQKFCKSQFHIANESYRLLDDYIGWYRPTKSEPWSWVTITNKFLHKISKEKLHDCLQSVKSPVFFTGDSHLRYLFYALMDLFADLPPEMARTKIRYSIDYKNFHYFYTAHLTYYFEKYGDTFTPFFPAAKKLLLKFKSNYSSENQSYSLNIPERQIFAFSVGAFDVEMDNVKDLRDNIIPQLAEFIITLCNVSKIHGGKVIFLTSPPRFREFDKREEGRNNARIAAYNKLLIEALRPHGVKIFNFFAMTLNRYREQNVDGHHFLPAPNSVGENVAFEFMHELCQ